MTKESTDESEDQSRDEDNDRNEDSDDDRQELECRLTTASLTLFGATHPEFYK